MKESIVLKIDFVKRIKKYKKLAHHVEEIMKGQPEGHDLDGCDQYIRELQSWYSTINQKAGEAETIFNIRIYKYISKAENLDHYKLVKNSSTLTLAFMAGKFPAEYNTMKRLQGILRLMESTFNNYRTLISAFKSEREMAQRTVKQTG